MMRRSKDDLFISRPRGAALTRMPAPRAAVSAPGAPMRQEEGCERQGSTGTSAWSTDPAKAERRAPGPYLGSVFVWAIQGI
jgi:hypothetical protein